ncbi:MAG: LuxR C-terminal-related transcriptional regulator [Synergistaceae bacterium]|nr:LuxR C-terminal-related transcriptional regulator [Synergistaceae bacterium]
MDNNTSLPVSLPEICAPRKDLLRSFDRAAERQIVFIQAPGGYGKTVSTLLWLKKTDCRSAWRCFDEYDNTPALFYRMFCLSLLSVIPQNEDITAIANAPAFRDAPVEFTIEFLTRADYGAEQVIFILDDFHAIGNEAVIKSLPFVLKRLPDNITVFMLSRSEIPNSFGALQNAGKVSLMGVHELALSIEEIKNHLASYGRFPTEQEAEAIRVYSEGWIILINMIAVGGNAEIGVQRPKITIQAFFERNLWNVFDEQQRLFLIKTSIPERFTIELCEALTGAEDCEETLDKLVKGNANLSCSAGEFRYHQLFLEFLRGKALESDIDLPALYRAAAEYYLDRNDVITGRCYAAKSGNAEVILRGAAAISQYRTISYDEYMELQNIFGDDQTSDAMLEKMPLQYMQKMYIAYLVGNRIEFEHCWDRIYSLLPDISERFPKFMQKIAVNSILDYRIKFSEFVDHVGAMPKFICENEVSHVTNIGIQMPFLHRSSRDCYECVDGKVRVAVVEGAFRTLLKYDCDNLFLGVEAGLYLEQNRLEEAREILLRSESLLTDNVSYDLGWATYIMLAETALYKGEKEYERYKARAREYFESRQAVYYNRNFLAYEARALLWDGDERAARKWLDHYFVSEREFGVLYKIYQNFTTVRAYIVLGQSAEALSALNKMRELGGSFDRPLDVAEADVLIAIIKWVTGEKKEARDRISNLLTALCPYGFVRIVANEGKAVLPILSAVLKNLSKETAQKGFCKGTAQKNFSKGTAEKDFSKETAQMGFSKETAQMGFSEEKDNATGKEESLYRFVREVYLTAYDQSKRFRGLTYGIAAPVVKLSKQQALILELLASGYKNAEIVKIVGISLNTVRYHTKITYQKLEVTNAMDAIVKARRLGILK